MAAGDTSFTITSSADGSTIASGNLVQDNSGQVVGISGSIYGQTITGLSTFNKPDDLLVETVFSGFRNGNGYELITDYGVDSAGLSFSAGGVQYNVLYTGQTGPESGPERGAVLTSDNGLQVSTTFNALQTSYVVTCFASDTLIETFRGAIAVEALTERDRIVTLSGTLRSVLWLGSRTIDKPVFEQCPVRIRAGAFGGDLPERDLFLSPGHPVLVGDHLVPIMCLVNGTTIERYPVESVTYWHVELDQHDILLAEGLPCESYFDMGSRPWFAGSSDCLHAPEFVSADMPGRCRPVAIDGPVVEAERRRLDDVFAADLVEPCAWPSRLDASRI